MEFDSIGLPRPGGDAAQIDIMHIDMMQHMLDAGLDDRVLLSMDGGWFDPGRPDRRAGCIGGTRTCRSLSCRGCEKPG